MARSESNLRIQRGKISDQESPRGPLDLEENREQTSSRAIQGANAVACTLGSPIARDPAANQLCPDLTPQDEVAAIRTAFCR